uniref:Uncharacterized protein n=1 Tax=Panagrolaimus sp. ES5 TaxID=591445 RepID=A0AC34G2H5_9BILA
MQFNGGGPNYAFPQALICDATTGIYTFEDMGGIQQPANSIECICRGPTCGYQPSFTAGQMVMFTPPESSSPPTNIPDSMCYFHHSVTCTDVLRPMVRLQNVVLGVMEDFTKPVTVFCPAGYTGYLYRSADGTLIEAYALTPNAAIYCPP